MIHPGSCTSSLWATMNAISLGTLPPMRVWRAPAGGWNGVRRSGRGDLKGAGRPAATGRGPVSSSVRLRLFRFLQVVAQRSFRHVELLRQLSDGRSSVLALATITCSLVSSTRSLRIGESNPGGTRSRGSRSRTQVRKTGGPQSGKMGVSPTPGRPAPRGADCRPGRRRRSAPWRADPAPRFTARPQLRNCSTAKSRKPQSFPRGAVDLFRLRRTPLRPDRSAASVPDGPGASGGWVP